MNDLFAPESSDAICFLKSPKLLRSIAAGGGGGCHECVVSALTSVVAVRRN